MKDYTDKTWGALNKAADRALTRVAMDVASASKKSMKGSASRGSKLKNRPPSPAGEPPNVQTGALRASIGHALVKRGMGGVAHVGAGGASKAYAAAQEFGNRTLPSRPYLRPAMLEHGDKAGKVFAEEMRKATGGLL